MRVGVSGKGLDHGAGYARALYERLRPLGVQAGPLVPPGGRGAARPLSYALADGLVWPRTAAVDLLHYPADTGALVPARVPVAATVHGLPPCPSSRGAGLRRTLGERLWLRRVGGVTRVADAVITASEFSAREIHRTFGVPARRLHVIPHGVDTGRFHPGDEGDAALLEPLGLPQGFVLFLGSPAPRRNVPLLIEATARLGVPLVAAGVATTGDEPVVRALAAAPHARWLGKIPDELVAPLLRAAAVLALPSSHEGAGWPVLEAMACGTPVVVSDRGVLPEVAGGAARTVRSLTVGGLAAALAAVLADESYAVGLREQGFGHVRRFTWEEAARRHLEVFRALVG
ncbi:glycosyltransferase family 4 protein [Actinomadura hibisca]|uniref:glycosyltransferase family 4 protein n=1 Tax=Actinomadura hibisca TaxID=68565 RepID=UPI000836E1B7|nr:glycosyltransferase family 1 protein [Actinomadura hibisca]